MCAMNFNWASYRRNKILQRGKWCQSPAEAVVLEINWGASYRGT